jgi:hypothetical protein
MVDGRYFFTTSTILVGVVSRRCRSGKGGSGSAFFTNESQSWKTGYYRRKRRFLSTIATASRRIVHLGFGAFHRAHQAVYADILAAEHGSDWGYCEVNLIGGEQQIADLKAQDNLLHRGGDVCRCMDISCGWRGQKSAACAG